MRGFRISIARLMLGVFVASAALVSLMFASELVAGVVLLATLALLMLASLGVGYRRGDARAFRVGFALFGWGYMALASGSWWDRGANRPELATTALLDQFYPVLQRERNPKLLPNAFGRLFEDPDPRNRSIFTKLDEPFSMNFPNDTPLEDVIKYISQASQDPAIGLPTGIPIYLERSSRKEQEQYLVSTVSVDVQGVPLRATLGLILKQLGLTFDVRDGLLTISKGPAGTGGIDTFRRVGHCVLALAFASLGGLAGLYLSKTREASGRS